MNSSLEHLLHAAVIAVVIYLIMKFMLGYSNNIAIDRSLIIGAIALVYMIFFGHFLPRF